MKPLKEQIDELLVEMEKEDDKLEDEIETEIRIDDLETRVEELELTVKALSKCIDMHEMWHRMAEATIDKIVETIDRKEE